LFPYRPILLIKVTFSRNLENNYNSWNAIYTRGGELKVVYHERYNEVYASDPAAGPGRIEAIYRILKKIPNVEFVQPKPASREDLLRVHGGSHVNRISTDTHLWEIATLAAGGAIKAAQLAHGGNPAFGLIRPPGHHASADSCWGFCYFNNMSVALERLRDDGKIKSAFILDFDLHFGDGNVNILEGRKGITILNPESGRRDRYIEEVKGILESEGKYDIAAISAGFDEYEKDWGGKLKLEDYTTLGSLMKNFSDEKCKGRRFAILEGGYYLADLGLCAEAFIKGFE
jgi:acetoin utilization deacetylase AcuC-like enzyme